MPRQKQSQKSMILSMLEQGTKINPMLALNSCGCFRLAAVICDLRKEGHKIKTDKIESHTGNKYAEYSLA
jgi:hypothetical protein